MLAAQHRRWVSSFSARPGRTEREAEEEEEGSVDQGVMAMNGPQALAGK